MALWATAAGESPARLWNCSWWDQSSQGAMEWRLLGSIMWAEGYY